MKTATQDSTNYTVCGRGGGALNKVMALFLYALLTIERLKTNPIKIAHTHTAEVKAHCLERT